MVSLENHIDLTDLARKEYHAFTMTSRAWFIAGNTRMVINLLESIYAVWILAEYAPLDGLYYND